MNNRQSYLKDYNFRDTLKTLAFLIVIFLLRKYLYLGIKRFIITPFKIDSIKSDSNQDILSIIILLIGFSWILYLIIWHKLLPTLNTLINIGLITISYFFIIRSPDVYEFEVIKIIPSIAYLDVLLFSLLILLSKFKYYDSGESPNSIFGFIEDNFDPKTTKDILGRKSYAHRIGLKILGTKHLEKALVIAINSPWGFGKSGFLLLIEEFLNENRSYEFTMNAIRSTDLIDITQINQLFKRRKHTVIVRYNPWKNFDEKKIVQDFFRELSASLNKYDYYLSRKIKKYAAYLTKLDDSLFTKIIESTITSLKDETTLTGLFDEINKSLQRIQKKIIVFVDDLDRLTADELIDVLKLIRNTANFKNTFFIVAYDHNYVLNTIGKKKLISSKEDYLQKIVQLEITLPTFQTNILNQFLEEQLKEYNIQEYGYNKIQLALNELLAIKVLASPKPGSSQANTDELSDFFFRSERIENSLLLKVFQNVRDVIRFINSFKLSLESIGQFGDIYEIILLELLKIKYLSIFQLISKKYFLKIADQKYVFKTEEYESFLDKKTSILLNIKLSDKEVVRVILDSLFNSNRKTYFRSIKHPKYFDIYFTYQVPKLIQLEKIESALKAQDIDGIFKIIDESRKEDTLEDLRNFLDSQTEFTSKHEFEIIFRTLFYLSKFDSQTTRDTLFKIKAILRNDSKIKEFYDETEEEYSFFLLSVLKGENIDLKTASEIAGDELYNIINTENQNEPASALANHKTELQGILLNYLKRKMTESNEFDMELFAFYLKNLKDIEAGTRRIVITEDANNAMKIFIINHAYEYLRKYLLREHPEPSFYGRYFQLDPFLLQYFDNNWESIRSLLGSSDIKLKFKNEDRGEEFYNVLVRLFEEFANEEIEKKLITDKREIELIRKFITILQT